MKFSDKLKVLRAEHNLTQDDLADKIYVTRTAISKWETDNGYPSIESLKQIAMLFNTTVDELINDEDLKHKEDLELKDSKTNHAIALVGLAVGLISAICLFFIKIPFVFGMLIGLAILSTSIYLVFTELSLTYYKDKKLTKKQQTYNKFREILAAVILFLILLAVVREI